MNSQEKTRPPLKLFVVVALIMLLVGGVLAIGKASLTLYQKEAMDARNLMILALCIIGDISFFYYGIYFIAGVMLGIIQKESKTS